MNLTSRKISMHFLLTVNKYPIGDLKLFARHKLYTDYFIDVKTDKAYNTVHLNNLTLIAVSVVMRVNMVCMSMTACLTSR